MLSLLSFKRMSSYPPHKSRWLKQFRVHVCRKAAPSSQPVGPSCRHLRRLSFSHHYHFHRDPAFLRFHLLIPMEIYSYRIHMYLDAKPVGWVGLGVCHRQIGLTFDWDLIVPFNRVSYQPRTRGSTMEWEHIFPPSGEQIQSIASNFN